MKRTEMIESLQKQLEETRRQYKEIKKLVYRLEGAVEALSVVEPDDPPIEEKEEEEEKEVVVDHTEAAKALGMLK